MTRLRTMPYIKDIGAVSLLLLLWIFFFWQVLTPIEADKVSFTKGDFSAQFVTFGAYQHERWRAGEVPLWNPYNNGGLPFIGDTQAAVFYPPRLLTIALHPEWSYHALELEAIAHVLLYSLLTYLFLRRLTIRNKKSHLASLIGTIVASYGGFISGYPPLQLALLEAAIWLPLGTLGILEATRNEKVRWRWIMLAGFALGLSWLAGHPQTSWFLTYMLMAWLAFRVWSQGIGWQKFVVSLILMGLVTFGTTAVTFLPSVEYLALASRSVLGFEGKQNGFPIQDVVQMILPASISLFSPLYVGIPALIFALIALFDRSKTALFWGATALISLLFSFGGNAAFYEFWYYILPGLYFFRGQERAAVLFSFSLVVLASIGVTLYFDIEREKLQTFAKQLSFGLFAILGTITLFLIAGWLGLGGNFGNYVGTALLSTAMAGLIYTISRYTDKNAVWVAPLLVAIIVFELFSVNMTPNSNYDPVPPEQQIELAPPPVVQVVLDDTLNMPYRVDGRRGLGGNFGSLYNIMDIRGISPLFLGSAQNIIYRGNLTHTPLAWELFAVRYVWSERESFSTPTTVIETGFDEQGAIFVHELDNPRPFAHLAYNVEVLDSDEFALALLENPNFNARDTAIIVAENNAPQFNLSAQSATGTATINIYKPENIVIDVSTAENAILSLAQVDYPGWVATIDSEITPIHRAYGALMAIDVPAGDHTIELTYNPLSYRIGTILSAITWISLAIIGIVTLIQRIGSNRTTQETI